MRTARASLCALFLSCGLLTQATSAVAGGVVTQPTEASLRAAMTGGGTVTFACNGTITLTKALAITQDTTLDATGYQVTLSGGNAVRLFAVTNATLRMNALTLADGRFVGATGINQTPAIPGQDAAGACILNQGGTVTLVSCTLTNHLVHGGDAPLVSGYPAGVAGQAAGGAIFSQGGQVNLTNCLVTGCNVVGGAGGSEPGYYPNPIDGWSGPGLGGALYVSGGSLNLQSVMVVSNSATGGPGGAGISTPGWRADSAAGYGGGVCVTNANLCAGDCRFTGNVVSSGACTNGLQGGSSGEASGGALFLVGNAAARLTRCTWSNNAAAAGYQGAQGTQGGSAHGGAVFNGGMLQVDYSTWSGNAAVGAGHNSAVGALGGMGQGGALYSTNTSVLAGCTFYNNLARGGDGFHGSPMYGSSPGPGEGGGVWSSGSLLVTNSTWATNQASAGAAYYYGGPASGGGVCITGGSATLVNVTLAGNLARYAGTAAGPLQGGGLCNTNGLVQVMNSVLAYSSGGSNVYGIVTDGGYNLSSDSTGGFSATGSQLNVDPKLAPLANYGGPTATFWLLSGSPARDQSPAGYPPVDQRGAARPQGPAADIGAVEADDPAAPAFTLVSALSGGHLTLSTTGDAWRAYRLLSSSNLVTWTSVATNSPSTDGVLQFNLTAASPTAFYRVVTP